jgi:KUP system potassium uptake protein
MATITPEAALSDDAARTGLHARGHFWALTLGCIGVVYGDIGTSPLYALRESVLAAGGASGAANTEIILGILSLIIWALILVVTVKYVLLLLRADNDGEGGTLALMALAQRAIGGRSLLVLSLGIIGAALFYGDAMLTPAVSVLSAVEGLEIAAPGLHVYVVPLTVLILVALFAVQSRGTASVAAFFGPITLIWFLASPANTDGASTSCPPPSSCRAVPSALMPGQGCRRGRTGCSSCLPETPMMRAAIFICPLTV